MKLLKFKGRFFVLLRIVLLLSFLAVRECKWHTWQAWLIIRPGSALMCALTNGSEHRGKKTKQNKKQSRKKKASGLTHLAPLSNLTFPFGCCCGLLLQSAFPASAFTAHNKHLPPDSHISSLFMSQLWKTEAPLNQGGQDTAVFTCR